MAVPMAYGDSRSCWRTQSDADVMRRMQQQAALNSVSPLNSPYAMINPYQNVAHLMTDAPKQKSTPSKVIADQGFGGAESRPRSRRYRKEPLRLPDVDAT